MTTRANRSAAGWQNVAEHLGARLQYCGHADRGASPAPPGAARSAERPGARLGLARAGHLWKQSTCEWSKDRQGEISQIIEMHEAARRSRHEMLVMHTDVESDSSIRPVKLLRCLQFSTAAQDDDVVVESSSAHDDAHRRPNECSSSQRTKQAVGVNAGPCANPHRAPSIVKLRNALENKMTNITIFRRI